MTKLRMQSFDLEHMLKGKIIEKRAFMFNVDREKAFKKLAKKQFKNPHLALREIVSNALDSYGGTSSKQVVDIWLDSDQFEVVDYGTGFTEEKIECLRTLGQSDKRGERGYIGRFGIGFASLFNPDLQVKRVLVDTRLNQQPMRLEFNVEGTGVTLQRYDIGTQLPFSTRIRAEFQGLPWETQKNMRETLENEAKYMNAEINLNGCSISGKAIFNDRRKYAVELSDKVSGRLSFFNSAQERYTESKVAMLSHNIFIASTSSSSFTEDEKEFNLPPFFGFANSDELNVITSRNDFRKDEKYTSFKKEVRKQARKYFREICQQLAKTKESELREILLQSINNREFREYHPKDVKDACARALSETPLFTAWNQLGAFSLHQLYGIAKEKGHLLYASDSGDTELLDIQGYDAPIVRVKEYRDINFKNVPTYNLGNLYSYGGSFNEEYYGELVKAGIIDPAKLKVGIRSIPDGELSAHEGRFIIGLRKILSSPQAKKVLSDTGLATEYPLSIADITPIGIAACYDTLTGGILVNRKNPLSAQYLQERQGNTAQFYLPVLAHELSHNALGRHDNPFYALSSDLSSKLASTIAREAST